jgi:hypothetical protein
MDVMIPSGELPLYRSEALPWAFDNKTLVNHSAPCSTARITNFLERLLHQTRINTVKQNHELKRSSGRIGE